MANLFGIACPVCGKTEMVELSSREARAFKVWKEHDFADSYAPTQLTHRKATELRTGLCATCQHDEFIAKVPTSTAYALATTIVANATEEYKAALTTIMELSARSTLTARQQRQLENARMAKSSNERFFMGKLFQNFCAAVRVNKKYNLAYNQGKTLIETLQRQVGWNQ